MTEANEPPDFDKVIPVCPVRASVLYPSMVMPIDAGRPISIRNMIKKVCKIFKDAIGQSVKKSVNV